MCGGLAYMELAWIGDALLGPSTLLNVIIVLQCFRTLAAPARKSQLCSTSLATRSTLPQLQIENSNFVAHKSSTRSALPQLQLENRSASLVRDAHFRSSSSKIATLWYKSVRKVHFRSSSSKIATLQYKSSTRSTLPKLQLENRNFVVQV